MTINGKFFPAAGQFIVPGTTMGGSIAISLGGNAQGVHITASIRGPAGSAGICKCRKPAACADTTASGNANNSTAKEMNRKWLRIHALISEAPLTAAQHPIGFLSQAQQVQRRTGNAVILSVQNIRLTLLIQDYCQAKPHQYQIRHGTG
jgi:hypothetical protein